MFKGRLTFPSNANLLNYEHGDIEVVLNISIPDITSDKDVNGNYSSNIFTYQSQPFNVFARNPFLVEMINTEGKTVKINKNNIVSAVDNQVLQEKVEFDGFYVGTSSNLNLRVLMAQKDNSYVFPSSYSVSIRETKTDIYSGENLVPLRSQFSEDLLIAPASLFEDEVDEIGEDGNPTDEKIKANLIDFSISTPSYPVNLLVYVNVVLNGFRHTIKKLIVCANTLKIDLVTKVPSSDGISTEEQSATIYQIDPDDPTNVEARTLVPDGTPVLWTLTPGANAVIDRPFVSTASEVPNFEVPDDTVVSFTTNGVAKDIIFGPITEVELKGYDEDLNPIFEQYDINIDVFYNGASASAVQSIALVPLVFESRGLAGSFFLMEFQDKQQKFYTDGISYAKLTISHDPNTSVTRYASCFLECLNELGKTVYTLSPGTGVQIATDDPDVEIVYGSVVEIADPYTGRLRLDTSSSSTDFGSAIVPLENGDETSVYFRKNQDVSSQKINSISEFANPCDCLGNGRESVYDKEIKVVGSLTSIFGGEIETLTGGGSLSEGVPPTVLIPEEPSSLRMLSSL